MEVQIEAKLAVDPQWASHMTPGELEEYIRTRLASSMGFRMQKIKLLRVSVHGR